LQIPLKEGIGSLRRHLKEGIGGVKARVAFPITLLPYLTLKSKMLPFKKNFVDQISEMNYVGIQWQA
jgi:hypothetical protein